MFLSQTTIPVASTSSSTATSTVVGSNYSAAVRKSATIPVASTVPTLKDHMTKDLLSAVYVDLEQKRRRAKKLNHQWPSCCC